MILSVCLCVLLLAICNAEQSRSFSQTAENRAVVGVSSERTKRAIKWIQLLKNRFVTSMMKSNYLRRNFLLKGAELIDVRARTSTWLKPGGTDQYFEDIDMITNLYKQTDKMEDGTRRVIIKSLDDNDKMRTDVVVYSDKPKAELNIEDLII